MNAALVMIAVAAFGQLAAEEQASPGETGLYTFRADISSEHDSVISAEVEGTLVKLQIKEGARVAAGQVLALIDDRQAQAAVEVADLGHKAALERATDKVEEEFAVYSAEYAKADLEKDLEANLTAARAVTDIQIRQKRLALKRARLQIEKAQKDRLIAGKEADAKGAELKAAQIALDRRTIRAPFDGEVQQMVQKEAQWVNPGDPVLRLVQFDVLRVEGFVNASAFDPVELANRKVTVLVHLARDREATVTGRVTFVSQTVLDNEYQVRAEVQNQRDGEYWLLRPGLEAEMTIHLNEPPVDGPPQSAALPVK